MHVGYRSSGFLASALEITGPSRDSSGTLSAIAGGGAVRC